MVIVDLLFNTRRQKQLTCLRKSFLTVGVDLMFGKLARCFDKLTLFKGSLETSSLASIIAKESEAELKAKQMVLAM